MEALQWQGDEKHQWFYTRWKLIATSLSITIPEVVLRDTSLSKIRSLNKLQVDIVEFDRMREDGRRNLKWLTESIDHLLARGRIRMNCPARNRLPLKLPCPFHSVTRQQAVDAFGKPLQCPSLIILPHAVKLNNVKLHILLIANL